MEASVYLEKLSAEAMKFGIDVNDNKNALVGPVDKHISTEMFKKTQYEQQTETGWSNI